MREVSIFPRRPIPESSSNSHTGSDSRRKITRAPLSELDVEAEVDVSSREEHGEGGSRQHNHRGGVGRGMGRGDDGGGHRRDAHTEEVGLNKCINMKWPL